MSDVTRRIEESFKTGFIDKGFNSHNIYQSQLIMNDSDRSPLLSNIILEQLSKCESFTFQVAFITGGGLALLKSKLRDLKFKGVKGKLITSDYLQFNRPKIFKELLKIDNLEVKITERNGFHAKGYQFSFKDHKTIIIGSSNLTATALRTNHELNVLFHSTHDGKIIDKFESSFYDYWDQGIPLTTSWIEEYQRNWNNELSQSARLFDMMPHELDHFTPEAVIMPNKMQSEALENLQELRSKGKKKAILISATGTGKTYLSAFDVQSVNPKRCLYIAHREQILKRSMQSFQRVLDLEEEDLGLLSGSSKDFGKKVMFATVQSLVIEKNLQRFDSKEFDYIIIDEVHRAGAASYEKIFKHFKPKFMLGMSATPERTDGFNVFKLFDNNIAYEIRLQRALEENLLVPFHYYGVSDFEINGEIIDEQRELSKVEHSERMKFLLEKIEYYGHGSDKLRGLIFCSRKNEGIIIADLLNSNGFKAVFLSGEDSQEHRITEITKLESGELDYIVTVDIFNEGIDIPSVNQIVMLRQTKSSIIFIQQLGRGLRLDKGKDYLTVIDFIGNYRNNFLIPIALSGDKSHNKDSLRKFVSDSAYITGLSSVNFEEVTRNRIYDSINRAIIGGMKDLKNSYLQLKQRLNRIPFPTDFINHHAADPSVIVKKMTYSKFLTANKEEGFAFDPLQESFLNFIGLELMNGFRLHEVELIRSLMTKGQISIEGEIEQISSSQIYKPRESIMSAIRLLSLDFFPKTGKKKYGESGPFIIIGNDSIRLNPELVTSFNDLQFRQLCEDMLQCTRMKNQEYKDADPLKLYAKYGRKDVCRLLNWDKDETSTIYGYRGKNDSCPIFITYHKSSDVEDSVNYGDDFLNQTTIKWFTRSRRTLDSKEVKEILNHKKLGMDLHIFVKKDDDEGSNFYYLGKADVELDSEKEETMQSKNDSTVKVVTMNLDLKNEIPINVYDYLVNGNN